MMIKILLIVLGTISLSLGFIGVVTPGLPTTPFLLLSAGLYFNSSKRLYTWLLNNKLFGDYIRNYQKNKAISLKTKVVSILIMWGMISLSSFLLISNTNVKIIVSVVGIIGTIVMLLLPTIKK